MKAAECPRRGCITHRLRRRPPQRLQVSDFICIGSFTFAAREQEQEAGTIRELLLSASRACGSSRDLEGARKIHADAARSGYGTEIYVGSSLVDMYAKCRSMVDASAVFSAMPCHNVVSWTTLILGYSENGEAELALQLFRRMDAPPDALAFVAALVACANLATKEDGQQIQGKCLKTKSLENAMGIHSQAARSGYESALNVTNTLISVYCKCGSMVDARRVFDRAPHHSVVSWNALILGYAENAETGLALDLFSCMQSRGCEPDARTFLAALMAVANQAAQEEGKQIAGQIVKLESLQKGMGLHAQAVNCGYDRQAFVASSLVNLYAKCGSLGDGRMVFERMLEKDVVSWTALILGYAENGAGEMAMQLFERMRAEGCAPDARTYVAAAKACGDLAAKEAGIQVDGKLVKVKSLKTAFDLHSQAARRGFDSATNIYLATSLLDLYAKCGSMLDARMVFDKMRNHNHVSWNALLLGYAENAEAQLAFRIFSHLRSEGCEDSRTFLGVLVACSSAVEVQIGRQVHADICRCGAETEALVASCLVDFYCKCGNMATAQLVFDSIATARSLITWSALIGGYSRTGDSQVVFNLLDVMQQEGLEADTVTYLSVLTACSHAGLVERGKHYFQEMLSKQNLKPDIEHYHCMIDLLARGNRLEEAVEMVKSMPYKASVVTWNTVLGACKKWKNVEVGRLAFESLVKLDKHQASSYLAMASLYGSLGMREDQAEVLRLRNDACKP